MSKTIALIYAYWPNQPFDVTWCDLPWALRNAGLPKALSDEGFDVVESFLRPEDPGAEELRGGFMLAGEIGEEVDKAREAGELPVILCGSCAVAAIGAIAGLGGDDDTGIAWFDAHPDLHTPDTTTSGLFEGMALALVLGLAWKDMARKLSGLEPVKPANVVLFGARDIEEAEQRLIDANKIPVAASAAAINQHLAKNGQTYVHLDMDVHDELAVRANAFAVPGGPSIEDVRETLRGLSKVSALAITGLDPAAEDADKACQIAATHIKTVATQWRAENS